MSILAYAKQIVTWCHISDCKWTGHFNKLKDHVGEFHQQHIREIQHGCYFELSFEDLRSSDTFFLSTDIGMYWFAPNNGEQEYISRGFFEIANSRAVEYYIKLGTFSTKILQIEGPFLSQKIGSQQYDFNLQKKYMQQLTSTMTPKVVIFIGDCKHDIDEYGTCGMGAWPAEITPKNYGYPENYICCMCEQILSGAPSLCDNCHFVCKSCYKNSECAKCATTLFSDSNSEEIAVALFQQKYQSFC